MKQTWLTDPAKATRETLESSILYLSLENIKRF